MRLPRILRTTPFRLTLLFLALFAAASSAFLAYIYVATVGEVTRRADAAIMKETASLEAIYRQGGFDALNQAVIERAPGDPRFLYLLMNRAGAPVSGSLGASPIRAFDGGRDWASFDITETGASGAPIRRPARGLEERLGGGERLFVGADIAESEFVVVRILRSLWGAGALIVVLGLAGGILVSRNVNRSIAGLTGVIEAARGGDLRARATVRGSGDEYD
ncbi:MAG: sensor histidine kinase, partial [Caulobacteraceae bacterium]